MKPMLGFNKSYALEDLKYPVYASQKLDGIRVLIKDGVALSRKLLPIPNLFVQKWAQENATALEGLDGEIIVGHPHAPDCYRNTMSGVMSIQGEPDFIFWVFDIWNQGNTPFQQRLAEYLRRSVNLKDRVTGLPQQYLETPDQVREFEQSVVTQGAEGVILRYPDSKYKFGRSTLKEGALLKLKQFVDLDFEVLEIIEAVRNDNEAMTDELGNTKRSHSKDGRTEGKGYVGAMLVRDEKGREGKIGTFRGLSTEDKTEIFQNRERYIGARGKMKVMEYGGKDFPRHATFLGFRSSID